MQLPVTVGKTHLNAVFMKSKNHKKILMRSCTNVGDINSTNNNWEAEIHTNDNPTTWKLDTGAEACILSDKVLWLGNQPLRRTRHQLRGAGGVNLPVIEVFDGMLRYASKQIRKQIFVVKNLENSLLSKSACVELGSTDKTSQT